MLFNFSLPIKASDGNDYPIIEIQNDYKETLYGISWIPNGSYALLVGNNGLILKYDGVNLTRLDANTTADLRGVAWSRNENIALIAGSAGTIISYSGTKFTTLNGNTTADLFCVAWHPNGSIALIGGANGTIVKYDNIKQMSTRIITMLAHPITLFAISWDYSGENVWMVGYPLPSPLPYNYSELQSLWPNSGENSRSMPAYVSYALSMNPNGNDSLMLRDARSNMIGSYVMISLVSKYGSVVDSIYSEPLKSPLNTYNSISWVSTSNEILVCGGTENITLPYGNNTIRIISYYPLILRGVAWKPDGSQALIVGENGTVLLYVRENNSIINSIDPQTKFITISENQSQPFSIIPIGPTVVPPTIAWFLDGNYVSNSTNYTFVSNYTSAGVYNITVNVSIGNISTTHSWNLTVTNVHMPPEITNYTVPANLTLKEGENFTLNVSAIDLDGQNLTYSWHLDNISVSNTTNYTFQTNYTSSGIHNITVIISDGESNTTKSWLLNVTNVNLVPTARISSILPNPANKTEEITLIGSGNDTDGTIVAYQWRTNDTILGTNSTLKISNLSVGKHTIYFKVQDNDGNWSDEVSTTIEVKEKEKIVEKKAFIPSVSFNIVMIDILIIVALVELIRRKK
jgi:hypothetical protein